ARRWIKTRFLTRQQGEWFGYAYVWNDEEREGTLVGRAGQDRDFVIRVAKSAEHPDGIRKQKWHYPSRTECMVCHSRAANWVLGLSEVQMNRDHDYGGAGVENQLRVFEQLDLFKGRLGKFNSERFKKLADPYDKQADLDKRARAYLHANCAHCHVDAGGGNAQFTVEWSAATDKTRLVD